MELYQINISGEYKKIVIENNKKFTPKKLNKKNKILKQKIKILYNLYEQLYEKQNISLLEPKDVIIKNNIISYPEERQSEPINMINLNILTDIDERINQMRKVLNV